MPRTQIRASQLANQAVTPEKVAGTPLNITSINGIVSLPRTTNYFIVAGSEDVVNISGWNYGIVIIEWAKDRLIMHLDGAVELPSRQNRKVLAGDVSTFVFKKGVAREIACTSTKIPSEQLYVFEDLSKEGQLTIALDNTPQSQHHILFSLGGLIQSSTAYVLNGNVITLDEPMENGQEIRVIVFEKEIIQSSQQNVYDGGVF